jgi:hypothetical protein
MSPDKSPDEKGKPTQSSLHDAVTQSYKSYVNRLKGGAKSGISHAFGNASDIFGGAEELPLPPRVELTLYEPRDEQEFAECFVNLAKFTARGSRQFLDKHMQNAKDGLFDAEAKKLVGGTTSQRFLSALKLLTCANIHLNVLEQIDPSSTSDWVKELAYLSMCYSDKLNPEPPLPEIIRLFSTERQRVCKAVAGRVGRALGFGDIGDAAWNAVLSYLRESSDWRGETLRKAVVQSSSRTVSLSTSPSAQDPNLSRAFRNKTTDGVAAITVASAEAECAAEIEAAKEAECATEIEAAKGAKCAAEIEVAKEAECAADIGTTAEAECAVEIEAAAIDLDEALDNEQRTVSFKAPDGSLLWHVQFAGEVVEKVTMASGTVIYKTADEDKNVIMYGTARAGEAPKIEVIGPVQVDPRAGNIIFDSLDGLQTVVFLNNGYRIDKSFDGEGERAYLTAPKKSGAEEVREEVNAATGEFLAESPRIDFSDENARLAIRFLQAL